MEKIVPLGYIYYLQNPITKEIFYIGATEKPLKERLKNHYKHLKEAIEGKRKMNKRFEYLINLGDNKATIHLLQTVTNDCLNKAEKYHIKHFKTIYPNLTNMTIGGESGNTSSEYTEEELIVYKRKISESLKGVKKPAGFAENLSIQRKGKNNPALKEMSIGWIVCDNNLFKHTFEIDNFIGKKSASSNVIRNIKKGNKGTPYGLQWELFSLICKERQDIVQKSYENKM